MSVNAQRDPVRLAQDAPSVRRARWWQLILRDKKATVGAVVLGLMSMAALLAPWVSPYDPNAMDYEMLQAPSLVHPLGTDDLGRDGGVVEVAVSIEEKLDGPCAFIVDGVGPLDGGFAHPLPECLIDDGRR